MHQLPTCADQVFGYSEESGRGRRDRQRVKQQIETDDLEQGRGKEYGSDEEKEDENSKEIKEGEYFKKMGTCICR
jgi:hypothetical protein